MNKVMLTGRLTKDPELRYTPSGTPVCRFNLAVSRPSAEGDADLFHARPGERRRKIWLSICARVECWP